MQLEDRAAAYNLRKQTMIVGDTGGTRPSRDFQQLVTVVTAWVRRKQLEMKDERVQFTKRLFFREYKSLGYKKGYIKAKWAAATSETAIQNKLCFKKGKKMIVWYTMPKSCSNRDIVEQETRGEAENLHMSKHQAAAIVRGDRALELSSAVKIFNGFQ